MNDISGKLSLYHNLFLACLVLAFICFALAIALFFILDIRSTLGYLTGRRAKKKIREFKAAAAQQARAGIRGKFLIERELILIHTEEVI